MGTGSGAVHVTTQRRHYTGKDGQERVYETHLLRRSWREGGKVRNETVANLSKLPDETIEAVPPLAGRGTARRRRAAGEDGPGRCRTGMPPRCTRWPRKLGLPGAARPARPGPGPGVRADHLPGAAPGLQAGHPCWWDDVTLGPDLGVGRRLHRRRLRRDGLAGRAPGRHREAARRAATCTRAGWPCSTCPPRGWRAATASWPPSATPATASAARPRSSTGCSPTRQGRPVAVRVFAGNTADPSAFTETVDGGAGQVRAGRR